MAMRLDVPSKPAVHTRQLPTPAGRAVAAADAIVFRRVGAGGAALCARARWRRPYRAWSMAAAVAMIAIDDELCRLTQKSKSID